MTNVEMERLNAICKVAGIDEIGELSDGFHTFNGLYEQRLILFAALVKAYKNKAWKSYRHEDGEYCFGGGWFIVGIDTPEGSYTYHYENKYWDMFDCIDLPRAKHWDGHTEEDAETRLMSLEPEDKWIPCSKDLPEELIAVNVTWVNHDPAPYNKEIKDKRFVDTAVYYQGDWYWWDSVAIDYLKEYGKRAPVHRVHDVIEIIAWRHLPKPWEGEQDECMG